MSVVGRGRTAEIQPDSELVSVVIPAYNAEATIRETLASALAQTFFNLEVILVDDGSTDATAAIAEGVAAEDPRVRLLRQSNRGVAAARNHGVREARGGLIAFLDADDLWHPTKIAKQVEAVRRSATDVGLVYTWYRRIDAASRILSSSRQVFLEGDVYAALVLSSFVGGGSTAMIPRACVEEVGGFDGRFQGAADTELFLRVAERYDFAVVPEYLMGYRQSAGSMSRDIWHMLRQVEQVLVEARHRNPQLPKELFRWGRGRLGAWLARESLRADRVGLGAYLLLRTLLYDPATVLRRHPGRALLSAVARRLRLSPLDPTGRRLLERSHLCPTQPRREDRDCIGRLFLDAAPEPAASMSPGAERGGRPRVPRRLSFALGCSVRSRPAQPPRQSAV